MYTFKYTEEDREKKGNGYPLFLSDFKKPGQSDESVRQIVKKKVDSGELERVKNGIYYRPYTTALKTKGLFRVESYIKRCYLYENDNISGYITGLQLVNESGFTSQNTASYNICTNAATTKQRKENIGGKSIILYKPVTIVTKENAPILQFLDLVLWIDRYAEVRGEELKVKLKKYIENNGIDVLKIKGYLPLYPDRIYKNLYEGGVIGELV